MKRASIVELGPGPDGLGIEPYSGGIETATESIAPGTVKEEIQGGLRKAGAIVLGRRLLRRMRGAGWKLSVWQNLGWHYAVTRHGALRIDAHVTIGKTLKVSYSVVMSRVRGSRCGEPDWYVRSEWKDPNKAADFQLRVAADRVRDDVRLLKQFGRRIQR